jgi:SAM-dependent methyltransferase
MFPLELFDNLDTYVAHMRASLGEYSSLLAKEKWLTGREVLDLGSGLGQYSQALLQGGAASVTGLEYQASKTDWSSARFASPRLRFVTGSAEAMPFATGSFDTVFSQTVFEHITGVESALREIRRVLRPGGFALISYNYFHHRGGHHLFPYVHFPWASWVVSEAALCEYWSERLAADQAAGRMGFFEPGTRIRSLSEGAEIHLNKLSFAEFEAMLPRVLRAEAGRMPG